MIKRIMKGLLAVCCALTMVSIQGVYAAEGEPVIIDDTDERFVYSEGDANHGGWGSADGSDPAASEHWSNTPGATLEISFEGNVLEIYGIKAPNHLMFTVSIDGGETSDSSHRHTAAVGWDCNDSDIISCKADCGKIGAAVCQVYDMTL